MARTVRGIAVTGGFGVGPAFYVGGATPHVDEAAITPDQVRGEIQKFNRALNRAKSDLEIIKQKALRRLEGRVTEIFDAQIMMLDDRELYHHVTDAIRKQHVTAEWAYQKEVSSALEVLRNSKDEYLRQMEGDIGAVARRVIHYLQGLKQRTLADLESPSVLLAEQLTPADLVQLPRENVIAIATRSGSRTDHTALVARSLGIPAVVGIQADLRPERKGQRVLVDAEAGEVHFSPDRKALSAYAAHQAEAEETRRRTAKVAGKPAATADGHRVHFKANLELLQEAGFAAECGAEGVGLFRTEFLFISAERLPDEDAQTAAYVELADRFAPDPVTLRVYDLGGDKLFYSHRPEYEPNPAMGWRAVRLLLDRPALFRTQLRAMFRAAAEHQNVHIMFPMISSLEEWRRVIGFSKKIRDELKSEGIAVPDKIPLGAMIEVPAIAFEAGALAAECDFFSVGTNDLVQYLLAVDRQNPQVANRYQPYHPAVLSMLQRIVNAARAHHIPVAICGDLASDLRALPLLVGLGFTELSTVPGVIPQLKALMADFTYEEAVGLTKKVLAASTSSEIRTILNRAWRQWNRRAEEGGRK